MAQDSIEGAEKKEFTEAKILLKLLENAFSDEPLEKILEEFLPSNEKCKNIKQTPSLFLIEK